MNSVLRWLKPMLLAMLTTRGRWLVRFAKCVLRQRLKQVWLDPMALDPSRQSAKVTREIAERLAEIALDLEEAGHTAEQV